MEAHNKTFLYICITRFRKVIYMITNSSVIYSDSETVVVLVGIRTI